MSREALEELIERHYTDLVSHAGYQGAVNPQDVVQQSWLELSRDCSWMNGHDEQARLSFFKSRMRMRMLDEKRKVKRSDLAERDDVDPTLLNQDEKARLVRLRQFGGRWSDVPGGLLVELGLDALFKRILAYQGGAATRGYEIDEIIRCKQVNSILGSLNPARQQGAIQNLVEIIAEDLMGVLSHVHITSKPGQSIKDLSAKSPGLQRHITIAIQDLVMTLIKLNPPVLNHYTTWIEPHLDALALQVAEHLQELGVEDDGAVSFESWMATREMREQLRILKIYLETLTGEDIAKGKALLLRYWQGKTRAQAAGEMGMTVNQFRYLESKALQELEKLSDA